MEFSDLLPIEVPSFSLLLSELLDLERDRTPMSILPLRLVSATAFVLWMRHETLNGMAVGMDFDSLLRHHPGTKSVPDGDMSRFALREIMKQMHWLAAPAMQEAVATLWMEIMQMSAQPVDKLHRFADDLQATDCDFQSESARGIEEMIALAGRKSPQFLEAFTPSPIVELMAQLAAENQGGSIYDPCCGSGGLLIRCAQESNARAVAGGEIHPLAGALACARLALSGIKPNIALGDTLAPLQDELRELGRDFPGDLWNSSNDLAQSDVEEQFDIVVMNPPFGMRLPQGQFGTVEQALMLEALRRLRPGGRLIACLPAGFFFNGNALRFRESLLREMTVELVISLPERSFAPFSSVARASLLVVRKERNGDARRPVRFADLKKLSPNENYARLTQGLMSGNSSLCWEQTVGEILASDCDLTVSRYVTTPWDAFVQATSGNPILKWSELNYVARILRGVSKNELSESRLQSAERPKGLEGFSMSACLYSISDFDAASGKFKEPFWKQGSGPFSERVERSRLKECDLLVTVNGTIGKCFSVDKKMARNFCLPSMAVVRQPEGDSALVPLDYLSAILSSSAFEEWAKIRASGSGVRHLRPHILGSFPIPMLSPDDQQKVIDGAAQGFDILEVLRQLTSKRVVDSVTAWLAAHEQMLPAAAAHLPHPSRTMQHATQELAALSKLKWIDGSLQKWLKRFGASLGIVHDIERLPDGLARLTLLGDALSIWRDLRADLDSHAADLDELIAVNSAREIIDRLSSLAQESRARMLQVTEIEFVPQTPFLTAGQSNSYLVELHNRSALPLRSFEAEFSSFWEMADVNGVRLGSLDNGSSSADFDFAAKDKDSQRGEGTLVASPYFDANPLALSCQLDVGDDADIKEIGLMIKWRAVDFAGQTISDSVSLSVVVRPPSDDGSKAPTEAHERSLGPTPYLKGSSIPVTDERLLFGRENELRSALETLMSPVRAGIVIVEGNRRIGKTSLLHQIERLCSERFLVVRCSLQTGNNAQGTRAPVLETREFYRLLCSALANVLIDEGVDASPPYSGNEKLVAQKHPKFTLKKDISKAFDEVSHPSQLWDFYLGLALDYVSQSATPRGVLLLMDEFDKLPQSIEVGTCEAMVPENLRAQLQEHSGFTMVIAGSQGLKRMRQTHLNPIFGLGKTVELNHLDASAAARLVTETPPSGTIAFAPDATRRIVELCDGRPYFLQGLCDALWNYGQSSVTLSLVEKVARDYASKEEALTDLWKEAGQRQINETNVVPHRRGLLLALAARHQGEGNAPAQGEPLRLETFERLLDESRVSVPSDGELSVGDDLDALCQLKLLRLENSIYRFTLPLLATWIANQKDFEVLRSNAEKEGSQLI